MNSNDTSIAEVGDASRRGRRKSAADLLRQYGCGPVMFSGEDGALYESHLMFDRVGPIARASARDKFEAAARSARDVLSQRWVKTEETYQQRKRAIIDAIHDGSLARSMTERDPVFGFDIVAEYPNVPSEILIPRNAWAEKTAYDATAKKLAGLFNKNFETYASGASAGVRAAAPKA